MEYSYTNIKAVLGHELAQKREEGCDVQEFEDELAHLTRSFGEEEWKKTSEISREIPKEKLENIYNKLTSLDSKMEDKEPSNLEEIIEKSPAKKSEVSVKKSELKDRIYGAWLGRCAGCLLGKPVEGFGGSNGKEKIEEYLKEVGEYPLRNYFPEIETEEFKIHPYNEEALRGNITHMPRDDDIDYPILNLNVLESSGKDFKSGDIAEFWLKNLPFKRVYTAERAAYKNLVSGISPLKSGRHFNPYREWIGAQIRGDVFGWVNPGKPEQAARMAYRDSILSHRKNGVYGEMFVAAALAAAMGLNAEDIDRVIDAGLSVIPQKSRLAEAIRNTVDWAREDKDWKETYDKVIEHYGQYHGVHTINNAAIVVLSLIHGEKDYEKSICTAVMCGHDTDCNGATVGSIVGALKGAETLPKKWIDPLDDRVESIVIGDTENKISDLAKRTLQIAQEGYPFGA
ncbi:hypothetical protein AKJ64_04050 [candidate division MSBL1 archaeon SCGC-AAA259E17]|uniref:Crystallin n=1 Tax=candidate division MSBL1 archaeon SCGC-AAA259E17 TaxID=1698263 RepID=A0A133UD32_9EURY|nr:hypothetical protein AKJ64_04050 [candidate division MSBL1 archaeon SCGC-AAA259E17]